MDEIDAFCDCLIKLMFWGGRELWVVIIRCYCTGEVFRGLRYGLLYGMDSSQPAQDEINCNW